MKEVFLNSKFVGTIENTREFLAQIKTQRRRGILDHNVNIFHHPFSDQIYIETTRGRIVRPLIVVKEGKSLLQEKHIKQLQKNEIAWEDLLQEGIIEYLDAAEEENAYVAFYEEEMTQEHTHLEITPFSMFGLVTSLVPFGNHSPPSRLSIGAKNQKQGLGLYAANFPLRMDMDVNILHTPHMPIVKSVMHDIFDYAKHPSGQNIIVAVMSYKGYNMEDAIVINKGSIECGFGRSTYYRPLIAEELRYSGGLMDEICVPDKEVKGYKSETDYRLLEDDGIIFPEGRVEESDVVIGKTSPPRFLSGMDEYNLATNTRRESSISLGHGEKGTVDAVMITENEEGNRLVQVRLRDQRIPEIGDKFTSRHGQKGVVGLIVPHSEMPFSANGMVPDLVFSPHGLPSRMTISHMLELLAGKTGALSGRYVDGTIFEGEKEKDIRQELLKLGFKENGMEVMFNGLTGEQFTAEIFIGNMYYLKLKHMVADKLHSRALGPIQLLTRQPTEGRAKEGGLRLGEMEKDTFIAHGASILLKERFDSDKTVIPICESCGIVAIYDSYKDKKLCPVCGENVEISDIEVSYAFKLILDEFKSLGVYPKIELETKY